jgi:hypothetical protein
LGSFGRRREPFEEPTQRSHEQRAGVSQLGTMLRGKPPELVFTGRCQADPNLPAVFLTAKPFHQSPDSQAIHQADRAVVLDQKMARQIPHSRSAILLQSTDCQQHLMLLRLEPFIFSRSLAEMQESANLVSKRR